MRKIFLISGNMGGVMTRRYLISLALIGLLFIMIGCGGGGGGNGSSGGLLTCGDGSPAPAGSVIKITPGSVSREVNSETAFKTTQYFNISVTNENGIPYDCIELTIDFPLAVPHVYGIVQLYNGTTATDSPMTVTTDEYGVYNLRFDFWSGGTPGLAYKDDLFVVSGAATPGVATFEVTTAEE